MDIPITIADVALILSSATAIAAVAAPVITSVFTNQSNERINREEIRFPRIYDALQQMSQAYASMKIEIARAPSDLDKLQAHRNTFLNLLGEYTTASYLVVSLINDPQIQNSIIALEADIRKTCHIFDRHDKEFCDIMRSISLELSKENSRTHKRRNRKKKSKQT